MVGTVVQVELLQWELRKQFCRDKKSLYYCVDFLENYIKAKCDNLCRNCEGKKHEQ